MKKRWTMTTWLAMLIPLVVILVACGPADPPDEEATSNVELQTDSVLTNVDESLSSQVTSFDIYAGIDEDDIVTTDSGLQYIETIEGDGDSPEAGQIVSVHYTGWLEDGTQFDSSVDRGEPFQFALGLGMVIPGWDEGVALMKQGGSSRLVIPAELGYGAAGAPGTIPPDATLVFDVELLEIREGAPENPPDVAEEDLITTDSGLQYIDIVEGDGPTPETGQAVIFHYTGWMEDGSQFDSSLNRGQPVAFQIGDGQVIPGWDEALSTMQVGTKRFLIIPPELGFGEEGAGGGIIPPNATLLFELELVEIQ
jgi:peptidylprolyl isomerase